MEVQGASPAISACGSCSSRAPSVMLQAMKEEPPLAAKCKDKFLIQSTLITPEKETLPLQDIVRAVSHCRSTVALTQPYVSGTERPRTASVPRRYVWRTFHRKARLCPRKTRSTPTVLSRSMSSHDHLV